MQARPGAAARDALGWVVFEVVLALAIAIGIVWWTIPRQPKDDGKVDAPREDR